MYLGGFSPIIDSPFTFCIPSMFGFDSCLGCGVGRSITEVLHGDFIGSFEFHPFGILAVGAILFRMVTLYKNQNTEIPTFPVPPPPSPLPEDSDNKDSNNFKNDNPI